ncbi:RDD family protein [Streptomyces sp. AGS-58]|uniref:RDD family protein n=1 Tax=unclassified Streptomyces TaxID=2593676 RepID=UPI0035A2CFCC
MSAPTPAAGDDRPREGYYPDPSIPGYVRYWNGASWVPGTSRPAPRDGEPLIPPAGIRPAAPSVEETGPHFFDEDPADPVPQPHPGPTGAADPWPRTDDGQDAQVARWGRPADPGASNGAAAFGGTGEPGEFGDTGGSAGPGAAGASGGAPGATGVSRPGEQWGGSGQPDGSAQSGHHGQPGLPGQFGPPDHPGLPGQFGPPDHPGLPGQFDSTAHPGHSGLPGLPSQSNHSGFPAQSGHAHHPGLPGLPSQSGHAGHTAHPSLPSQSGHPGIHDDAGRADGWGVDPRVPAGPADGRVGSRTDGAATVPPPEDEAPDPGTFLFRRPIPGPAARTDDGTMTFRPLPSGPAGAEGGASSGPDAGPAGFGTQGPVGAPTPTPPASSPAAGNHGFGAGKAAAARTTAAPATEARHNARPGPAAPAATPPVPQQPGAPATPLTSGAGGGQSSWAQQVHQLAGGGDEQPPAPWKPPVEDVFQAAARRQAAARPAGLGKRFAARLIDLLVLGAVTAAAAVPLGLRAADHVQEKIDAARLSGRTVTVWLLDGTTGTSLGIVLAVLLLAGVLYEVLPTARWGRTLGKKVCGLQVRDIEGHEPPAFGPALRRWLVFSVPGLLVVGVVGMLWCLFDRPWHQCWHDKAAHTFVAG